MKIERLEAEWHLVSRRDHSSVMYERMAEWAEENVPKLFKTIKEANRRLNASCGCGAAYDDIISNHQADNYCYPKGYTPGMYPDIAWIEQLEGEKHGN